MNVDMLVFGEDWGALPSSTQHLIRHLLPEMNIVWVNSLGLRRPKLCKRDMIRAAKKLARMVSKSNAIATDFEASGLKPHIVNPRVIPWPGNPLARRLNESLLTNLLQPILANNDTRPILWTSLPSAADVVGKLGERACIYYCGDDFSALDGVDHEPVAKMEQDLVKKVDLIIAASHKIASKFPPHKTLVLPHGVDFERFSTPSNRADDLGSGPVAGFYGSIAGWFDKELMLETAKKLPHWRFVLIGPAHTNIKELTDQANIEWLGPKAHKDLVHYSQHWDVGILPFKNNAQIQACNPLKLREYLAAGQPIVSTHYPAVDDYSSLVSIAGESSSHFADKIEEAYKLNHKGDNKKRQASVEQESWHIKAQQLKDILLHL